MKVMSRRYAVASATCAVLALAVTACSSSGGKTAATGGSPNSTGGVSTGSTPTGSKLTIGAIGTFSGANASTEGGVPKVLAAWQSTVNAAGGIAGHSVKVIVKDIGAGPASAGITAAQELISQDHVLTILDWDDSDKTWLKYANSKGVPIIQGSGDQASPLNFKDIFPVIAPNAVSSAAFVTLAKQLGGKLGLGYCAEAPACAMISGQFKAFGLNPAVAAAVSSSSPDFTAFCQSLKDAGVNSYFLALPNATGNKVVDQCTQQGLKARRLLLDLDAIPSLKSDSGYNGTNVVDVLATPYWDDSTPAGKAYRDALNKYSPGIVNSDLDQSFTQTGWAAAEVLSTIVPKISGDVTSASLTSALQAVDGETFGGLTAPLNWKSMKGTSTYCTYAWKISGGQFVQPDKKPNCADPATIDPFLAAAAKAS